MVTEVNSLADEIHLDHEITEIFRYSRMSIQYTALADCVLVSLWCCHKVP